MVYISCRNDCLTEQTKGQLPPLRSEDSRFKEKCGEGLWRQSSVFNAVHVKASQSPEEQTVRTAVQCEATKQGRYHP